MITVDVMVMIDRPLIDVFHFIADLRNEPKWWTGVSGSERVSGDGGVGTRYRFEARLLGVKHFTDVEVVELQRPHLVVIESKEPLPYRCEYRLSQRAGGVELRLRARIEPVRPWGLLGPLLPPILTLVMRRYMRRLDRVLPR